MRSMRSVLIGVAVWVAAGCTSIAPVKVNVGDQCERCRRTIADERMAGEMIIGGQWVSKFRAPGCMAKYIVTHGDQQALVFVTDYATGKMIAPEAALFVPLLVDPNTGERDYRAFLQKADAIAAATALKSEAVSWKTVLDRARS